MEGDRIAPSIARTAVTICCREVLVQGATLRISEGGSLQKQSSRKVPCKARGKNPHARIANSGRKIQGTTYRHQLRCRAPPKVLGVMREVRFVPGFNESDSALAISVVAAKQGINELLKSLQIFRRGRSARLTVGILPRCIFS